MGAKRGRPPHFSLERFYRAYGSPEGREPKRRDRLVKNAADSLRGTYGEAFRGLFLEWVDTHDRLLKLQDAAVYPGAAITRYRHSSGVAELSGPDRIGREAAWNRDSWILGEEGSADLVNYRKAHDVLFWMIKTIAPAFPGSPRPPYRHATATDPADLETTIERMRRRIFGDLFRSIVGLPDIFNPSHRWFTRAIPWPFWGRCVRTEPTIWLEILEGGAPKEELLRYPLPVPCPTCIWKGGITTARDDVCQRIDCEPTIIAESGWLNLGVRSWLSRGSAMFLTVKRQDTLNGYLGGRPPAVLDSREFQIFVEGNRTMEPAEILEAWNQGCRAKGLPGSRIEPSLVSLRAVRRTLSELSEDDLGWSFR